MNFSKFLLSSLFIVSFPLFAHEYGVYYKELKELKKNPATKELFDKDAHPVLSEIQRDIEIFKNLTYFPRLLNKVPISK